jgi:D-tyrosyl-tRNA(Tyr) deacylase
VYVGAARTDTAHDAAKVADRVYGMRIFADEGGKMNLSLAQRQGAAVGPEVLAVSNFTLLGDPSQRRPSFAAAAPFEEGRALFEAFVQALRDLGASVETGVFGADMQVFSQADGPVTLVVGAE